MLRHIIKLISTLFFILIVVDCRNQHGYDKEIINSSLTSEYYQSMIIKYEKTTPWNILREFRSLKEFLRESRLDSIVIRDSNIIRLFVENVEMVDKMPLAYDSIPQTFKLTPSGGTMEDWILEPSNIDVEFVAYIKSNKKVDTLVVGRHPNCLIQYNQTSFRDSIVYYELLTILYENGKSWRDQLYYVPSELDDYMKNKSTLK